jgi:hypothetical protein
VKPVRLALSVVAVSLAAVAVAPSGALAAGSTAPAQVFSPNPVADLGIETLTDQKDADFFSADPQLRKAYHRVTLTDLDGSGTLTGRWVRVRSDTGKDAVDTGSGFVYTRNQDQFEQTMAYYWITQAQHYLQSLGFGSTFPAVNQRQVSVRIDQFGGDNSFFRDTKTDITYGKGGVDDAEDAEVIVHEYGHSVQDAQIPGFGPKGAEEAGAIGEGFSDYLAEEVSAAFAPTADEACIADWDSTSYTPGPVHCLRRLDGTKMYPGDLDGEVHDDGEIWSRALWDIRNALGARTADQIIVLSQFGFAPDTSMPAAAARTIATAGSFGRSAQRAVRAAFAARGLA